MSLIPISLFVTLICQRWFRMNWVLLRSEWKDIRRSETCVPLRALSKDYVFSDFFSLYDVI